MIPVLSGDVHTYALLTLSLRKVALQNFAQTGIDLPVELTRAVFRLNQLYKEQPDLAFYCHDTAKEIGAKVAYIRLNGDIVAICEEEEGDRYSTYIRLIDLDDKLLGEWRYGYLRDALRAANRWMIDIQSAPTGWVDAKGAVGTPVGGHCGQKSAIPA